MKTNRMNPIRMGARVWAGIIFLMFLSLTWLAWQWILGDRLPEKTVLTRGERIEVNIDACGDIPAYSIVADSYAGLFHGLGFVHAAEDLFSLEVRRYIVRGDLSSVLGPAWEKTDAFMRQLDLYSMTAATDSMETICLQAYAEGLNRYAADRNLGAGFKFYGLTSEPWTVDDVLAVNLLPAFTRSREWQRDMILEELIRYYGRRIPSDIFPHIADLPELSREVPDHAFEIMRKFQMMQQDLDNAAKGEIHLFGRNFNPGHRSFSVAGKIRGIPGSYFTDSSMILPGFFGYSDSLYSWRSSSPSEGTLEFGICVSDRNGLYCLNNAERLPLEIRVDRNGSHYRHFNGALVWNDYIEEFRHSEKALTVGFNAYRTGRDLSMMLHMNLYPQFDAGLLDTVSGNPVLLHIFGDSLYRDPSVSPPPGLFISSGNAITAGRPSTSGDEVSFEEPLEILSRINRISHFLNDSEITYLDRILHPVNENEKEFALFMKDLYFRKLIFHVFHDEFYRVSPFIHDIFFRDADLTKSVFSELLKRPGSVWWNDLETPATESMEDVFKIAFRSMLEELVRCRGPVWQEWEYGNSCPD